MSEKFDVVIIGGGIVGLATAMALTERLRGKRIAVLEKESKVAAHQSGHNSGVIHSGLYYRPGSLKAKMCVEGAAAMLDFCQASGIPYQRCGKVVVATSETELPQLEALYQRGVANNVPGLAMVSAERLREIEPHAAGIKAIHVPGTAITDYAAVTIKYAEKVEQRGGEVRTDVRVLGMALGSDEVMVQTTAGDFAADGVINCAGLYSDRVAGLTGANRDWIIAPFRGEYYELARERQHLVNGLIYPVPDPNFPFLGVHLTRMISGGVEAGPNAVLALKREGYGKADFNLGEALTTLAFPGFWRMAAKYWRNGIAEYYRSLSKPAFVRALQRLLPEIRPVDLAAGGSGVRAQALDRQGRLLDDFHIIRSGKVVHVCNVPSPAATASLVIGRHIAQLATGRLELIGSPA